MSGPVNLNLVRKAPRSSEDLLTLLFEGLDWPKPSNRDIDEIPLMAWSPEELHLDPSSVSKLTKIRQLPKLTDAQPFGVFILSFEGGRLPVGAVRRVVNKLVRKQRATRARAGSLWDLHDLIFFCQSDTGTSTLHIVAFKDTDKVPVMKVISWSTDATDNRIALIANENLPDLVWPTDGAADVDSWREQWSGAFTASYREGVRSADALATRMADVAKVVRDEALALYEVETEQGPLRELYREIKVSLKSDLTAPEFADLYAQTMVYGLLTARITHPEDFHADAVSSVLKFDNPFLDALYSNFRRKGDQAFDVDEFGLHDLAELLARTDVNQLLADFGVEERKEDPVVFFYENFLELYDPDKRRELGTYYTPIPVVRFMVQSVDTIVERHFHLEGGIADSSTWADYSKAVGSAVPKGLDNSDPVIRMVDPATGTGTFLLEWYRQATNHLANENRDKNLASIVERMDAFEINASSYAVSHLKTGLELPPHLRQTTRVNIRLTDTLERSEDSEIFGLFDPIAEESAAAEKAKFVLHHSVVIGNPPYKARSRGLGGWIESGPWPGHSQPPLDSFREAGNGSVEFVLSNLYIYFWRWAIWKAFEHPGPDTPAVVAFITPSAWLHGIGFRGMRRFLRKQADTIWVIDLGGENRGTQTSENIFPIETPVAIVFVTRSGTADMDLPANVSYVRLDGTRIEKLSKLSDASLDDLDFDPAQSDWTSPFAPEGRSDDGWNEMPTILDILPWQIPGVLPKRQWVYATSPKVLKKRWRRFIKGGRSDRSEWMKETTDRSISKIVRPIDGLPLVEGPLSGEIGMGLEPVAVTFRALDEIWLLPDLRLIDRPSPGLWSTADTEQVYFAEKHNDALTNGPGITAALAPPDMDFFNGRGGRIFPLWRDASASIPNLAPGILELLGMDSTPSADEFFCYLIAVLSHPGYVDRFSEQLRTPGARVPVTKSQEVFMKAVELGATVLSAWCLGRQPAWLSKMHQTPVSGTPPRLRVGSSKSTSLPAVVTYDATSEKLLIGSIEVEGVSEWIWNYQVSGWEVLPKWISRRTASTPRDGSVLDQIMPDSWGEQETKSLLQILRSLWILEQVSHQQDEILNDVMNSDLLLLDEMRSAGVLDVPEWAKSKPAPKGGLLP